MIRCPSDLRCSSSRRDRMDRMDRGSATVLSLGVMGVLITMTLAAFATASVLTAAHRARSAADLSGVAAAQVLIVGGSPSVACERAREVAHRNDSELAVCTVHAATPAAAEGSGPRVSVTVEGRTGVSLWPRVLARAEAGLVPDWPSPWDHNRW